MSTIKNLGADLDGISPDARKMLDGMTTVAELPELRVRSGYRNPQRNALAGGANKSQHIHGNAVDLDVSGYTDDQKKAILKSALANGARGVGIYPSGNSLHIDTRSRPGVWGWNPKGAYSGADVNSAPEWAREDLVGLMSGAVERAPLPSFEELDAQKAAQANRKLPSWWNTVEQTSASLGVDPDTLYRIAGGESRFRNVPNASGPGGTATSTAHGPFQIVEGTWAGLAKNYPELGLTNRLDPEQQAKAAPYLLREYRDDVKRRIGRDLTQGEQYLAWFLGPRDAAKVLNAPSGANPKGLVTPASIAANPTVFRKVTTTDELREWAEGVMRGRGVDGAPAPEPVSPVFTEQFKDTRLSVLDLEPTTPFTQLERRKAERDLAGDAYSLPEGLYRAVGQEATGQILSWMNQPTAVSDPNFQLSSEMLKTQAADIPEQHFDYLSASSSEADFQNRLTRLRSDLEVQQKLGAMGGTGVLLQLGAALVDPAGWVAAMAAAPIGGAAKASTASRILFGAAEGAAGNLALEGAVSQIDPTWDSNRLIYAGAGGLLFGGAFGAMGRGRAELAESTALMSAAQDLKTGLERDFAGSSAGAAQNTTMRAPVRTDTDAFMTKNFGDAYGKAALSKVRFDLTSKLKASENPLVRALGHVFTEETVGNADGSATMRAVSEDQVKLQKQHETIWYRDMQENWKDYAKRNGLNSVKDAHTGALADFNRQVTEAVRSTDPAAKFDPAVSRQAGTFRTIMGRYLKLAQGDRMDFDGTMRAGLPGFADLSPNDVYAPRIVHWGNFRALTSEFGTEGLTKLVTRAMRGMNPDLSEEAIERVGKGYVKRLSRVEAGQEMSASRIFSSDDIDEMRANLEGTDIDPADIDAILRPLQTRESNGAGTPRGKRRNLLNENFSMSLRGANGVEREVRIAELFEGDADRLFQSYNRNMSGQIALSGLRIKNPNYQPLVKTKRSVTKKVPREVEVDVPTSGAKGSTTELRRADLLSRWGEPDGKVDLNKVGAGVVDEVDKVLKAGGKVQLHIEGKARDIVAIERGGMVDAQKRPWGTSHVLMPLKGDDARITMTLPDAVPGTQKAKQTVYDDVTEEVEDVVEAEGPEWLIDGIHNGAEWDKLLKQVRDVAASDRTSEAARESVEDDITRLQFVYDAIAGRPSKFDTSKAARSIRLLRDYIFTRVMGQVGFAQIAEIGMITSSVGLKAAYKSMPSLKAFIRDARSGRLSDEDARQLEWISTGGTDWIRGMSHIATDEFGTAVNIGGKAGLMDKAEGVMSRATRAQSAISGMSTANAYLQRWASKAALYKFLDMSEEGARVNRRRMRVLGLSDDMQERIFANIRKHRSDVEGEEKGSVIGRLNLEQWDPDTRAAFEHSIFRWSRKMIQENDVGQTNTILGHSFGKLLFQFRGFMFGAWTKNTLHNIHMRDWQSMSSVLSTMFFGALGYTAQTHLQSLGRADREEFLENRLNWGKLSGAAFQRAGWSSMFPAAIDQAGFLLGADPLFDTRTTGTPSQGALSFPAASLYDDAMNTIRGVSEAATGNGYSRQDARAAWSLLPFQNTLPMLWLFNNTAGQLPERDRQ